MTVPSKFRPHSRVSRNLKCSCVCFALEDTQLNSIVALWREIKRIFVYFFLALKRSKKVCKLFARKCAWKLSLATRKYKNTGEKKGNGLGAMSKWSRISRDALSLKQTSLHVLFINQRQAMIKNYFRVSWSRFSLPILNISVVVEHRLSV